MRLTFRFLLILAAIAIVLPVFSQTSGNSSDACAAPTFPKLARDRNMFNEQQEAWLGEILDAQVVKSYNTIEDPEGDYLQKMGERMLAVLPPTGRDYKFFIIDAPINNAFSLGGSRIYIARQLIAFIQNEDEFAGLLGHEIGHVITHQIGLDVTRMFRKGLGVTEVGDRKDIFDKWNQLVDIQAKKHIFRDEDREEDEQQIADRIGLYAMARAGYQPVRFADFFDRLVQLKGKTGNFFTDFFGTTSANSKRLRELIGKAQPLPPSCVAAPAADSAEHFARWQKAVAEAGRAVAREQVAGLMRKTRLQPPLRGSLGYIQFSPDGKYLLAQDESSIFVLRREPLANVFRVDALDAKWGIFSADSRALIFYDNELRVEKWDVETHQRQWVRQVTTAGRCLETALAPSGEVLACVRTHKDDFELELLDVATSKVLYSREVRARMELHFGPVAGGFGIRLPRFTAQFSPDSRYFVLGANESTTLEPEKNRYIEVPGLAVAYDLESKREISLPGSIKQIVCTSFVFLGADRIAGYNPDHPNRSALVRFPSGELIQEFPLEVNGFQLRGKMIAPVKGPYVLVTPAAMHPIAAIDLEQKRLALGYRAPALAIYDRTIAAEDVGGRVTFYSMAEKKPLASVQLPFSPLPRLEASSFSADGKWLAASGRTSGGVWNTETGQRALDTEHFTGGFFDHGQVFATSYKFEDKPKAVRLDPSNKTREDLYEIEVPVSAKKDPRRHAYLFQTGNLLISLPEEHKGRYNVEAREVRTNQLVWKHEFVFIPPTFFYSSAGNTLTLIYDSYDAVKAEAKNDPVLNQRYSTMPEKRFANLVQVLDPATGKTQGAVLVPTGEVSFVLHDAVAAGDTVLVYDSQNRTQVYSMKSGEQKGKVLGKVQAISAAGDKMLVENARGECELYDTATLKSLAKFTFPARLIHAEFASSGELLVLTSDQTVYMLNAADRQQAGVQ
ncbi:MAG TPA: M48 family metalloprotease [Candidatus Angelobacter sp.]